MTPAHIWESPGPALVPTPLPLLAFIRTAAVEYFVRLNTPVTPP